MILVASCYRDGAAGTEWNVPVSAALFLPPFTSGVERMARREPGLEVDSGLT
jgi:hypothetical protein